MCWPRVGEANPLFSLCIALWRPTALAIIYNVVRRQRNLGLVSIMKIKYTVDVYQPHICCLWQLKKKMKMQLAFYFTSCILFDRQNVIKRYDLPYIILCLSVIWSFFPWSLRVILSASTKWLQCWKCDVKIHWDVADKNKIIR